MNTKKIILLSCVASSMSGTAHCKSCVVEDDPVLHGRMTLPTDEKGIVHQDLSEQDEQKIRNLVQDFCTSYNANQLHRDDVLVEKAPPKMPSPLEQQLVLEEPMPSLASWDQSRPKADTPVTQVVAQKPGNRMDKQGYTQTRSVQSPSAKQSVVARKMEKFLTTVKKKKKSTDDHRFIKKMVGRLHDRSKKAKNITGTDQEKITKLVSRLGEKYKWNKDDQNKVIAELMCQGRVSPVKPVVYPDAVPLSLFSFSPSSHDIHMQLAKVQGGPVQARYTAKASGGWTLDVDGHVTHGTRDQRPVLPLKYRGVEWKALHDFLESQHTSSFIEATRKIHKQKMRTTKTKPSLDTVVSESWFISPELVTHGTRDVLDPKASALIHRFDNMFGGMVANLFGGMFGNR